jgi:secreted Zn-dependent insulinase-like peptidase
VVQNAPACRHATSLSTTTAAADLAAAAGYCCCCQVGPDDLRRNALTALLVQLAKRDAFNTLRTQQQLGYIVHM